MGKKTAIVTLLIGAEFQRRWESQCADNWRRYVERFGHELICVNEPLDRSQRSQTRSPSWQKCLVFESERFQQYDQIAWIDADILFNVADPRDIIAEVPEEKVGAVDSFADPTPELNARALRRYWKLESANYRGKVEFFTGAQDVYRRYNPQLEPLDRMMNGGVFVASPRHHATVFRHVYDNYEDQGDPHPSYYENVPLSYELVRRGLVHWLDPRFNHLWMWSKMLEYPFLTEFSERSFKDKILRRLAEWSGNHYERRVAQLCATSALLNCYCLHFAGFPGELPLVDQQAASRGCVPNLGLY